MRPLTPAMEDLLGLIAAAGKRGESWRALNGTVRALARRGLVEPRHCRLEARNYNWIATRLGLEVDEARRARIASYSS